MVEALRYQPRGRRYEGVTEFFHLFNPYGRAMALGSTQPLTEKSTRYVSWHAKMVGGIGFTTFPSSCADSLEILEASNSWNPKGLPRPETG